MALPRIESMPGHWKIATASGTYRVSKYVSIRSITFDVLNSVRVTWEDTRGQVSSVRIEHSSRAGARKELYDLLVRELIDER